MNCIIIEDVNSAIDRLEGQLAKTGYDIAVQAKIDSVEDAVSWLSNNSTDIIFLDIQLGDGLSFEIFDHVQIKTPVIFTTSYNEYAIKAFEVNSIAYLLKPVMLSDLTTALNKYQAIFNDTEPINQKIASIHKSYQKRILVSSGSNTLPVLIDDIAYFRVSDGRYVLVTTKDKKQYLIDNRLEMLELRLNPEQFFRINRQYIVNINAIGEIQTFDNGRLSVNIIPTTKEDIFISKERALQFKNWLIQ